MLLNYIGWTEAATLILTTLKQTFKNKIYTPDFNVKTGKKLGTTQFTAYLLTKLK
jgi:isocitrate dehydrogenase